MADVLGILKGTLDPVTNKVKKDDFKTKVEAEITTLSAGTPDKKAQAAVLDTILKQDTFLKMDFSGDGELDAAEFERAAKIDGKPEFTMEDVRALRIRRRPPAQINKPDETNLENIPLPLRMSMRELSINEGGYLQPTFKRLPGDSPDETYILGTTNINEDNPADPTKPIANNFTTFIGKDSLLYITGYEGNYKYDATTRKDTTDLFEYVIPLNSLIEFAAFNPKERKWIRIPGKDTNHPAFAENDGIDLKLSQIDVRTQEGRRKLLEYVKKHLLLDSSGKLDYTKLQHFKGALYHEGIGTKELREKTLKPTTTP